MDVEELYKKGLDNHDGVITHLEPDILECQVEALLQTKLVEKVVHTQSYPTLWDPVDCSLPGSSVHGILQAEILEWVAMSFSRGSSQPRDQTQSREILYHLSHQGSPDYVDYNKLKIDGNTRPPYLSLEKPICRSRSNS